MSGYMNSNHSGSASNLPDSTGGPFAPSFSGQSVPAPGFHHPGLPNIHGNLRVPNMHGSLAPRNATMSGPSSVIQQPVGSISGGRFGSNNLPVAISQLPHGHSGVSDRGMNIGGGPAFTRGMDAIGGSIHGLSSNMDTSVSHSYIDGMSGSPMLGNMGPRTTSSVGNAVGGGNIGTSINSSGLSAPGIASHMNLSGNAGSGNLNLQGSNGMTSGKLQQASPELMNMLGNYYSSSGGTLSQNQVKAGNNFLGSTGMLHNVKSQDSFPFGTNDFSQLTGPPSLAGGPQGQYGSLWEQGVGVNTIMPNQEFSFQNGNVPGSTSDYAMEVHYNEQHENVPVMQPPHYQMASGFNLGSSYPLSRQRHLLQGVNPVQNTVTQNTGLRQLNYPSPTSSLGVHEQLIHQYQQSQTLSALHLQQMSSATESYRDQSVESIQLPLGPDPYGLLGLSRLQNLKDPELATLALGIDLTKLGLNMESSDNLYSVFNSPWPIDLAEGPGYRIPACYSAQRPALQPNHFQNFGIKTLFYIFYSMPRDEAQLYAANKLYNEGWLYHRELRMWLKRIENSELEKTNIYERGSYYCFDPMMWDFIRKNNFIFYYEAIEKKPTLPSAVQNVR